MKRTVFFLVFLILIFNLFTLYSCIFKRPNDAQILYSKISEKMESLTSFEQNATLDLVFYVDGHEYVTRSDIRELNSKEDGDIYYYVETSSNISCQDLGTSNDAITFQAFNDGVFYLMESAGSGTKRICQQMTDSEFLKFKSQTLSGNFDITECSNFEITEEENGDTALSLYGFGEKAVDNFKALNGIDTLPLGAEITDLKITLVSDGDYRMKSMKTEAVFGAPEIEGETPVVSISSAYSNYDRVEKTTARLNQSIYTKLDDIPALYKLESLMQNLTSAKEGTFTLNINQTVKIPGKVNQTVNEKDIVTFKDGSDGYSYFITASSDSFQNGDNILISYKNGERTVNNGLSVDTDPQTDEEAKAYISSLMNTAQFDKMCVSSVSSDGKGNYTVYIKSPEAKIAKSITQQLGVVYQDATQTLTFTVESGVIKKVASVLEIDATLRSSYSSYDVQITYESTFEFG